MIIFLYGKTGAGKDFLANYIVHKYNHAKQIKRPTTRPMRHDQEKRYYDFYTPSEFEKIKKYGGLEDCKTFRGWKYGIYSLNKADLLDEYKINILTGDKQMGNELKRKYPSIVLVEVDADREIRYNRIKGRESLPSLDEAKRRMASDDKDYLLEENLYDYKITNNGFEGLVEIKSIIEENVKK